MAEDSVATFMGGFVTGECWASVYQPEPEDYPFSISHVDMLVGASAVEYRYIASVYALSGTDMTAATVLGSEAFLMTGSSSEWSRLSIPTLELGLSPIESGNFAISICHDEHGGFPSIAVDSRRDAPGAHYIRGDIGLGMSWYSIADLMGFGDILGIGNLGE